VTTNLARIDKCCDIFLLKHQKRWYILQTSQVFTFHKFSFSQHSSTSLSLTESHIQEVL